MNDVSTRNSSYKNRSSYVLENALLRAEFVAHGGRMVSLLYKPRTHEFLYQQPGPDYGGPEYDMPLKPEYSAGYDDMFPTIERCYYEDYPWQGTALPDHGEAWSVDWDVVPEAKSILFSYCGVRLPYRFSRRVAFESSNTLRFEYLLENLSSFPFFFIWSAHPMLVAPPGTRIVFPEDCQRAVVVQSDSGRLGAYADQIDWPLHRDASGNDHHLDIVRGPATHDHGKYFFKDRLSSGTCSAQYPDAQLSLTLRFPVESVPYAAVVLGEGKMHDRDSFLLLEPCTAPFDRLDLSRQYTRDSKVEAKGTEAWYLKFTVDSLS
jgi:hypothetical protein